LLRSGRVRVVSYFFIISSARASGPVRWPIIVVG
jgi:hypothetical protein